MAEYPSAVYSPRTKENKSGVVYTPSKKTVGYTEDVTKLDDEVVAIETELGTEPSGAYATVKAWLTYLAGSVIAHKTSHQNGGSDEISVAGLSGELADNQPPKTHNLGGSEHGADTLANLNLKISDATIDDSGDARTPSAHKASHQNGGSDEISVAGLSGELADNQPPKAHQSSHEHDGSDPVTGAGIEVEKAISFFIDGGGSAIDTGIKGSIRLPFKCEIVSVSLLTDQSGSIVVDIWKDTYANYPPTDADTITSSTPPTISASNKSEDTTLTSWTKAIASGDVLMFNVDSASTVEWALLTIKIKLIE